MINFKSLSKQFSTFAVVCGIIVSGYQAPTVALPGQSFSTVRRSIEGNSLWSGNSFQEDSMIPGTYRIRAPFKDGRINFEFSGMEVLEIQDVSTKTEFSRDEGEGLDLVRQVWGDAVAADFANSKYTDNLKDVRFGTPAGFYKGQRYGYRVGTMVLNRGSSGKVVSETFTVFTLPGWESMVSFYRFCNKNPNEWECKVTL